MKKYTVLSFLALLPLFALAPHANAVTCTFSSITGVNFGSYDVFNGSPTAQTGSIQYRCQLVFFSLISIDLSPSSGGTYSTPRTMKSGLNILQYNLYPDATNSQVWGNGTSGTYHYTTTLFLGTVTGSLTVYGTIPAGQNAAVGSYSDSIIATVNF